MDERKSYDDKLARILRQASAIFTKKGYHRASIRDIAAAAGVSLSGLYYYFKSKEELLFLIQSHCFGTILQCLRRDLAEVEDPEERLRTLIRNHIRFFVDNMPEMKVLSHEAESLSGEYLREIASIKREYTREVTGILRDLAGEDDGVDLRVATFSLFGMMNWIYNWYRPEKDVSSDRLTEDMTHIFLAGFLSSPARRREGARYDGDSSIWRKTREAPASRPSTRNPQQTRKE